ncbi:flavin reductase (DIM6/NTAB) family NADH-FMN oxidoreductase RutF [Mucilaginibacter yixingensis]|uniref:Flavin reductase (DIM6/NTAB) family NADH-FMN oxidoreductase RutF n=1 Tax=Mucilaginibacter yixingensis TaxID=1295612 RepID=A0A2T5J7X4_9SPHI|nr:flavin reductase family protein [Mucilaginibacter yixingensis]PTQ95568.1 flavin reductase (DIM6/NTAB) family NADH-FMN oxidoreductase RutF [Mucilaginibacter yixingensis]
MVTINVAELKTADLHSYMQYAIAPRPICLASTMDAEGNVNLSPFSFFNMFSSNPPLCIFSPCRRVRDNTTKHTLQNLHEVPECVINIVNYDMVQQVSLASVEYPKGVNEFVKSGLTPLPSQLVKPPRVGESPVQMECVVKQIIPLGDQAGAGNLILAEVKLIHVSEHILDANGQIDQLKVNHVARLGGDWYCRVTPDNLFKVPKPNIHIGIGVDTLPRHVRLSTVLTGNDLGQLGNLTTVPGDREVAEYAASDAIKEILDATIGDSHTRDLQLHLKAKQLIAEGKPMEALMTLLID